MLDVAMKLAVLKDCNVCHWDFTSQTMNHVVVKPGHSDE